MLTLYDGQAVHSKLSPHQLDKSRLNNVLWIDLHMPDNNTISALESALGIDIPTPDDMREIETSSRLYREANALFMTATIVFSADTAAPRSTPVTFIVQPSRLITLRYADPSPFRRMATICEKDKSLLHDPTRLLSELLDAIVDRLADLLERTAVELDELSEKIFASGKLQRRDPSYFQDQLLALGRNADLVAKIRESLSSITRLCIYFGESERVSSVEQKERVQAIRADLSSLVDHSNFVNSKIQFLLEAVLGLVNIEQNRVIKALSVAATVFLPPTLIASIYGMNFDFMPELSWPLGYPMAIGLMVLSGLLPYLWLRKRAWI